MTDTPRPTFATEAERLAWVEDVSKTWLQPPNDTPRPIRTIAAEIYATWRNAKGESTVYFGAVPYLNAMQSLDKITDSYGMDPADEVIMYFLSNATTWRGPDARRIKAELKTLAGIK